jgi:hypothetical protein
MKKVNGGRRYSSHRNLVSWDAGTNERTTESCAYRKSCGVEVASPREFHPQGCLKAFAVVKGVRQNSGEGGDKQACAYGLVVRWSKDKAWMKCLGPSLETTGSRAMIP